MAHKSHPKLKLVLNREADIRLGVDFVKNSLSGENIGFPYKFLPYALHYTLNDKFPESKRAKLIKGYADYMYKDHMEIMKKGVEVAQKDWSKVERNYFKIVDKLFKNRPWPKGEYIAYSTVWHSYPRNIGAKVFYFPYNHNLPKYSNSVAAHELLHFMFYDHIQERYGLTEKTELPGKTKTYVWAVSEAFNNVIEEWEPYKKIFKHGARVHQGVEKIFAKMQKQWQKKRDVDWLLDQWF